MARDKISTIDSVGIEITRSPKRSEPAEHRTDHEDEARVDDTAVVTLHSERPQQDAIETSDGVGYDLSRGPAPKKKVVLCSYCNVPTVLAAGDNPKLICPQCGMPAD